MTDSTVALVREKLKMMADEPTYHGIVCGKALALIERQQRELEARDARIAVLVGAKWTPKEAKRLMLHRNAVVMRDIDEAHHQIYWLVAGRAADIYNPWAEVEELAKQCEESL
jgi:hypothetical protein